MFHSIPNAVALEVDRHLEQHKIFAPRCFEDFIAAIQAMHSIMSNVSLDNHFADVKANFGGRRHEISMNTYQMCICLLFNDNDSLTFKEIEAATKIPEKDLKRNLQSLALVKVQKFQNVIPPPPPPPPLPPLVSASLF